MSGRIPSVLEPYLRLPPRRSLTILTSILGTSVNWLVLRFLYIALVAGNVRDQDEQSKNCQVVLVSFLRDWSFWRDSAARLVFFPPKVLVERLSREIGPGPGVTDKATPIPLHRWFDSTFSTWRETEDAKVNCRAIPVFTRAKCTRHQIPH